MRKRISALFTILVLLLCLSLPAAATKEAFLFDLTVDGRAEKEAETGDIITVMLKLKRTDAGDSYAMYGMQDELRYDSAYLKLVPGSAMVQSGINTTDLDVGSRFREFYMNYLSLSGGDRWNAEVTVGTVQFEVIGTAGVTKIQNMDYLVSLPDGSGSYACTANDVTIILSKDCIVTFVTNGGTAVDPVTVPYGQLLEAPQAPTREGYGFDGWFKDPELTTPWSFDTDLVEANMTLYAKWTALPADTTPQTGDGSYCWLWLLLLVVIGLLAIFLWKYTHREKGAHEI